MHTSSEKSHLEEYLTMCVNVNQKDQLHNSTSAGELRWGFCSGWHKYVDFFQQFKHF